jgi:TP901 family phage tail tape measure protein
MTGVQRAIQNQLKNVSVNIQLKNGAKANQTLNQITSSTNKATKATQTFADAVGLSARRFVAYTSAVAVVGRLTAAIARGTRDAIKFEREFVKLAQVFDTNVGNLKALNKELSKLSIEYAISANVIAKTSVVLAQSGLTARQTAKAMAAIAKADLAPTFGNIASTAEGAVAIMAQFKRGAGKLADQLGAVNAVAKKFAVESQDIIEAVRRAGGAFEAAGGNFTEFIALFTAVRSTTRESAETIATGFRTIFARVQRPRTIEYFKKLNIELADLNGNFVGPYEAIRRLSEGLDRLGIKAGQI